MGFAQIIGQDRAIQDLQQTYLRDRVPNAYLFVGPPGVGKATTALGFARLLNCEDPRADAEPCEMCTSCKKILHGNHTDIWLIEPEKNTIKINQIRHMQRMVRFPPQEARMRVVVVDGVEMMNRESANAFLKVLEEPPPDNLFVLVCGSMSLMLPTIISRCQRVTFVPLAKAVLQQLLVERHGMDPLHAQISAGISEGSVGKALQLSEHLLGPERRTFLQDLPKLHQKHAGILIAMEWAEKLSQSGEQIGLYLDQLRMWLRDLLFLRELPEPQSMLINQDLSSVLVEHAGITTTEHIVRGIHAVEDAQYALRRNVSPLLTLEKLFLTLGGIA